VNEKIVAWVKLKLMPVAVASGPKPMRWIFAEPGLIACLLRNFGE